MKHAYFVIENQRFVLYSELLPDSFVSQRRGNVKSYDQLDASQKALFDRLSKNALKEVLVPRAMEKAISKNSPSIAWDTAKTLHGMVVPNKDLYYSLIPEFGETETDLYFPFPEAEEWKAGAEDLKKLGITRIDCSSLLSIWAIRTGMQGVFDAAKKLRGFLPHLSIKDSQKDGVALILQPESPEHKGAYYSGKKYIELFIGENSSNFSTQHTFLHEFAHHLDRIIATRLYELSDLQEKNVSFPLMTRLHTEGMLKDNTLSVWLDRFLYDESGEKTSYFAYCIEKDKASAADYRCLLWEIFAEVFAHVLLIESGCMDLERTPQEFSQDYPRYKEAMFRILEYAKAYILPKKAEKDFEEKWNSLSAEEKARIADYIAQLHSNKKKYS